MSDDREIPRVIIEWLDGLDNPPTVRAQGRSAEESEKILRFLEKVLMAGGNE